MYGQAFATLDCWRSKIMAEVSSTLETDRIRLNVERPPCPMGGGSRRSWASKGDQAMMNALSRGAFPKTGVAAKPGIARSDARTLRWLTLDRPATRP